MRFCNLLKNVMERFLKKIYSILFLGKKYSIVLNYHRIGEVRADNPFHRLHTVSFLVFKIQVRLCNFLGSMVSLDEITESKLKSRLNFSITFDDVSHSANRAFVWLQEKKIPFAICPCKEITLNNIGWRDQVYFIEKYISQERIYNQLRLIFPGIDLLDSGVFYSLSKSIKYDSYQMINDVVDPLFRTIPLDLRNKFPKENYISLKELLGLKEKLSGLTIVNHSAKHANLSSLTGYQVKLDVEECQSFLRDEAGVVSSYFAVPFGGFTSTLASELSEVGRKNSMKAILWVSNTLNIDNGPMRNKIRHLSRFHTPTTFFGLIKTLIKAFFIDDFDPSTAQKMFVSNNEFSIEKNPQNSKILAFEDVSRPFKDYSGNLEYFRNFYLDNPFLNNEPHTLAEIQDQKIMSIGHNLILPYLIDGRSQLVNFWGNWRGISGKANAASSILLGRAMRVSDIVASYKPSKYIEPTFRKLGWKRVPLKTYDLGVPKSPKHQFCSDFFASGKAVEKIDLSSFANTADFNMQVDLSSDLLSWRVDNYLLAKPVYFHLKNITSDRGLLVAQSSGSTLLVLGCYYSSDNDFLELLDNVFLWSSERGIRNIRIETSCESLTNTLNKNFKKASLTTSSCYFYSRDKSISLENMKILVTPVGSDVLLR